MVKASTYPPTAVSFNFRYPTVYRDGLTYPNEPNENQKNRSSWCKATVNHGSWLARTVRTSYLITADGATKGYDPGWDGYKTLNTDNVRTLYTLDIDNKRMQVSTVRLNDTYIGFRTGGESTYSPEDQIQHKCRVRMNHSLWMTWPLVLPSKLQMVPSLTLQQQPVQLRKRFKIYRLSELKPV